MENCFVHCELENSVKKKSVAICPFNSFLGEAKEALEHTEHESSAVLSSAASSCRALSAANTSVLRLPAPLVAVRWSCGVELSDL